MNSFQVLLLNYFIYIFDFSTCMNLLLKKNFIFLILFSHMHVAVADRLFVNQSDQIMMIEHFKFKFKFKQNKIFPIFY